MTEKVTEAKLTILHLLAERPRHGYEIEEVIEVRGMREWTAIGFSSIYYLLNKLEKGGGEKRPALAESWLEQGAGGPARKVYAITQTGLATLREGALAALANAEGDNQSLLLGLANLAVLEREEALAALQEQQQGLAERRERVAGRAAGQQPLPDFVAAMFDYSQTMMAARSEWLDNFVEEIISGRFDWPESREQFDGEQED
jgi:DNA-binding PadR family transcriptional regulator